MEVAEEFAGDGAEGGFGGFAGGAEAGVEGLEERMMDGGTERAEVEDAAGLGATALEPALAAEGAAVAGVRGEAGEAGQPGAGALAEFGQNGEERAGGDRANAGRLLQAGGFFAQFGVRREVFGDEALELGDAFFQGREALPDLPPEPRLGGRLAVLLLAPAELDELFAPGDQRGKSLLGGFAWWCRRGLQAGPDAGQRRRVERVGLGHVAEPAGELPRAGRVQHADGDLRALERGDDGALVAAGGWPAPSGAALRAKAPPFGYLAPLDSHTTCTGEGAAAIWAQSRACPAGVLGHGQVRPARWPTRVALAMSSPRWTSGGVILLTAGGGGGELCLVMRTRR